MLIIKPNCENCGKSLPNESVEAKICTFECTFCSDCVNNILYNVCPNCGGGFANRPTRPAHLLQKYPASEELFLKAIDTTDFSKKLAHYKHIEPHKR